MASTVVFVACFLLTTQLFAVVLGLNVEILSPIGGQAMSQEATIILIPGGLAPGTAYRTLGEALQSWSSFRLWVALTTDYPHNVPTYDTVQEAVNLAFKRLQTAGAGNYNVILAGHSLGGLLAADYAKSHAVRFSGVILFASLLNKWNALRYYPLPVISFNGDMDGLVRVTRILDTFNELSVLNSVLRLEKPVVIIKGMNHGHFIDDPLPEMVTQWDIPSSAIRMDILDKVATHTRHFLEVILERRARNIIEAKAALYKAFDQAKEFFDPLNMIKQLDTNEAGISIWTMRAQQLVAGIDPKQENIKISNKVVPFQDFVSLVPMSKRYGPLVELSTVTNIQRPVNPTDLVINPITPAGLKVLLVSQARVKKLAPEVNLTTSKSCKEINEKALRLALKRASNDAFSRWQTRGRNMTFTNDTELSAFQFGEALTTPLFLRDTGSPGQPGNTEIMSTTIEIPVGTWPFSFAGLKYCNLLSPFRALEWVYVDSLRFSSL